ncbi:hypothetical protein [Corallococcus llansteffanensis]|uniref:hypothetical protein n=1 Tax=Corallococcus llansteffanensis TaxID=2316731 RepID=UPI0011C3A9FB|nr:hypothetical protein [Corallococcus llansteffanensis]
MIRIRKTSPAPEVLLTRGGRARADLCARYEEDPKGYDSGTKVFVFNAGIYGHPDVRNVLMEAQHAKCAFCESKFRHIAYGDVEHFRPKAGCRQVENGPLLRPGYYWLAYEWENLYLSCALCNQRFKGSLFPLRVAKSRAKNHRRRVRAEEPLLIDPGGDEPERLIGFRREVPYAVANNARARVTIDALGLQRTELMEQRRERLTLLWALRVVAESDKPEAVAAREKLATMVQGPSEYSSMAKAFLREPSRRRTVAARKKAGHLGHSGSGERKAQQGRSGRR